MMEKSHLAASGIPGMRLSPHSRFARHSRAVGVLWGVFSVCFSIIVIVVFIQPHWIGADRDTDPGHMGLWRWCAAIGQEGTDDVTCTGELQDIASLWNSEASGGVSNTPFRAAAVLTGVCVLVTVISVIVMLLFFCLRPSTVYHIAGWMQILAGCLLGAAVCVYPLGFSSTEVRLLCGPTARNFNVGECSVRWAYVLAIIGVFDAVVLAALALVLATRTVKLRDYASPELYKGELGPGALMPDGASLAASRKSLNLQPVMMVTDGDSYRHSQHYHL